MKRLSLRVGDYYAIKRSTIERGSDGFFIVMGDDPAPNEIHGTVAVVHVRGALSQFKGEGGDSYESIVERVGAALAQDPKPSAVVLCISSPGGLVAGLNECVFKLQRMRVESGVPFIAQINELAASAAFALACACDRRFAPPAGIVGSIGTVSTMVSQAARDRAEGLDFRIITSGVRKADGHPHQPIEEDAVKAERARNAQLADQFFQLAAKALRQSPKRLQSLEAAIYVGEEALQVGLINAVQSFDETIAGLDRSDSPAPAPAPNAGNITDRRAKELDTMAHRASPLPNTAHSGAKAQGDTTREATMAVDFKALIAKTEAALSRETDPSQMRVLEAKLGTFQARAEMSDDDGDEDDKKKKGDDDGDDESASSKHAARAAKLKAKAKATDLRSKAAELKSKAAEHEEEAKKCEEESSEESEEEEARLRTPPNMASLSVGAQALIEQATGMKGAAAMGAAQALFSLAKQTSARVASLEKKAAEDRRASLLAQAKPLCFGKNEAKWLEAQSLETIEGFVGMRKAGGPVIHTDEGTLLRPKAEAPGSFEALPDDIRAMIDDAVNSAPSADRDSLRKALVENHNKSLAQNANGIGRY